jgi:O-antigen/teichoic acid export membrane protein
MRHERDIGAAGEIRRRSTRAVAVLTARGAGIFAIGFLANLALVRLLTPWDFGIVALGGTISTFAAVIVDGGFGAGLIRAEEAPDGQTLGSVLGVQLAVTGLLAILIAAAALIVGGEIMAIAVVMSVCLSITAVRLPAIIVLERDIRYGPIGRVDFAGALVYYAVAIPLAVRGAGPWSIVVATLVRELVSTVALLFLVPAGRTWPRLDFSRVRPLLNFGMQFQAVGIIQTIRDQLINILTAVLGGVTVTGLATLLTKILSLPSVIISPLDRVGFSSFSRAVTRTDDHGRLVELGVASVILPLGVVSVALAASAKPLVAIVFGHQWEATAAAVPWACIGCYMYAVTAVTCAKYLYAVGSVRVVLWSTAAHAAAMILTVICVVPSFGIIGVGLAWLAAGVVDGIVLGIAVGRRSGARVLRPIYLSSLLVAGSSLAGALIGNSFGGGIGAGMASAAAGVTIFLAGTLLIVPAAITYPHGVVRRYWAERAAL